MSPSETPAPSGITWEMAMNNAASILSDLKLEGSTRANRTNPVWSSARTGQAQAWIAFARELTMHERAVR
jgi:hypothetical protein